MKWLWADLETSGVNAQTCRPLEIALVVTDEYLEEEEVFYAPIKTPQGCLDGMDDWCKKTHGQSGLIRDLQEGVTFDLEDVDRDAKEFVTRLFAGQRHINLAGSSVHFDYGFMGVHFPQLFSILDHHLMDVSVFTLMSQVYRRDWIYRENQGAVAHRALDDVRYSMRALQWYMDCVGVKNLLPLHIDIHG